MDGRILDNTGGEDADRVMRQTSPGASTWAPVSSQDTTYYGYSSIAAETDGAGRITEVRTKYQWDYVEVWRQRTPNSGAHDDLAFIDFGSVVGDNYDLKQVAVARNQNGKLEIFALSTGGNIYYSRQLDDDYLGRMRWSPPDYFQWPSVPWGQTATAIAAETDETGRVQLFVLDNYAGAKGKHIWHRSQTAPDATTWSSWHQVYGELESLALARNSAGDLEVLGTSRDNQIYQARMTSLFGTDFSPQWWNEAPMWKHIGGGVEGNEVFSYCSVAAETNSDGRVEVWANTYDFNRWAGNSQTANGGWSLWKPMSYPTE
ncbi:hypothetical protein ACWCQZ_50160 [Streptomyces sp. NPDC002285]